ncbi:MAG: AAA family ATPase, partial [Planctomycetales bacterium]
MSNENHPIQRLGVKNFGCIREADCEFGPFTVLVGPNDSGKTMLLNAIRTLFLGVSDPKELQSEFGTREQFVSKTFCESGGPIDIETTGSVQGRPF